MLLEVHCSQETRLLLTSIGIFAENARNAGESPCNSARQISSDAFRVVIQTAIILGLAYALGAQQTALLVTTGVVGILLIFFTLAFFGLAWSGISLALGMKTRSSETVFAIGGVITFPLLFLSPALVSH